MPKSQKGKVVAIFIAPTARAPMQQVECVHALTGRGLEGDRYSDGHGSFQQSAGDRQVTLINNKFFAGASIKPIESRRNILTEGIELMRLINKEFQIGQARFRGVKYCFPCTTPHKSFAEEFHDCGGLIAQVLEGGEIKNDDMIFAF